jgi:hypothetical protein
MMGEHVAKFATTEDFWVILPNVGIILAYQQQERRHAYDQIRLYDAKQRLYNPYTPSSVHTITFGSPDTAEVLPATWPRVSTTAKLPHTFALISQHNSSRGSPIAQNTAFAAQISVNGSNLSSDAGSDISPCLRLPPSMDSCAELFR